MNMTRVKDIEIVEIPKPSWGLLIFLKTFGIAPSTEVVKTSFSEHVERKYWLPTI